MERNNSLSDECSVSAIIAQYLSENSMVFKELSDLRTKVF
jgi:hypothetical protein